MLKKNDDNTIVIHSKQSAHTFQKPYLNIVDALVSSRDAVRNIGATFDSDMTMQKQIKHKFYCAFLQIRNFNSVRKYLDINTREQLLHVFVTCRLDMYNNLLYGLPS